MQKLFKFGNLWHYGRVSKKFKEAEIIALVIFYFPDFQVKCKQQYKKICEAIETTILTSVTVLFWVSKKTKSSGPELFALSFTSKNAEEVVLTLLVEQTRFP